MIESLRPWMVLQALITLFLVLVLRLLHAYVHQQPFFRWWVCGWSCFALSLMAGWIVMGEPGNYGWPRLLLLLIAVVAAWLQITCFAVGARTLLHPPRTAALVGMFAIAVTAALATSVVSLVLHVSPETAYAIRAAPRQLLLALVYFYCALRLGQWARREAASGATIAALACAVYGVSQMWRFLDIVELDVFPLTGSYQLFLLDFACEGGIIVGMMLLLLQQNRAIQQRLQLYQAIVPTCCVCGAVREDAESLPGAGSWMPLHQYVYARTSAKFSHTFCPPCLEEYRRRQGLAAESGRSAHTAA